jgi:protein-S-isoprenylcysteine O-methyltransferase Ste14
VRHVPGSVRVGAAWALAIPYLLLSRPTRLSLLAGLVLGASGLIVRGWAAGSIDKSRSLATTGPYAHTRNPLYLGSFLVGIGLGAAGGHWIWPAAFLVLFVLIYVPTIRDEAARMEELFGPRYAEYAARVPAFVPRATPYRGTFDDEGGFE